MTTVPKVALAMEALLSALPPLLLPLLPEEPLLPLELLLELLLVLSLVVTPLLRSGSVALVEGPH